MARRRRLRSRRRRLASRLGLVLILAAVLLAVARSFERAALIERIFGWNALRDFISRTLDILTTAPVLVALLAVGGTLLVTSLLSRR